MRLQNLGYAITAHRAQGSTVDTAHVVASASTTREHFYVSMTRGRDSNIAYIALDQPDDTHGTPGVRDSTARTVLYGVLQHAGAELSAHATIAAEHETWSSIAELTAEWETIAAAAQRDRFVDLLRRGGLTQDQCAETVRSPAFGPLAAALRQAEAYHHDLTDLVPRVVAQHSLDAAEDIAAVLRYRVETLTNSLTRGMHARPPHLIVGLIPEALGPMDPEHRQGLDERKKLIENRARALAAAAVAVQAPWVRRLGPRPTHPPAQTHWLAAASTVAVYRDRYGVTSERPLGGIGVTNVERRERNRALQAVRQAEQIAAGPPRPDMQSPVANPVAHTGV